VANELKLYNIVVGYECWVLAASQDAAFEVADAVLQDGQASIVDRVCYDVRNAKDIRPSLDGQLPWYDEGEAEQLAQLGVDLDHDDIKTAFAKVAKPNREKQR